MELNNEKNVTKPEVDPFSAELDKFFSSYKLIGNKEFRLSEIRNAARFLSEIIMKLSPKCADRTAAIRKIREAVWTANFAIASDPDKSKYLKDEGYDPSTELALVPDSLKRDSHDLLKDWIENNMKDYIGKTGNEMGETPVSFAIRMMEDIKAQKEMQKNVEPKD